jgi:hypothetical protein
LNIHGLQSGFTAGELSQKMLGQVDFNQYQFGCETLENTVVWPQGMTSMRPGTRFVAAAAVPATAIRLIPFEFSTEQAYILEMGHEYFRFYMDQGQIISDQETLTIDVSPATDWAADDVITGQSSSETCVVVAKLTATTYTVKSRSGDFTDGETIGVTGTGAKLANQGTGYPTFALDDYPYTLPHIYDAADLFDIRYNQSADIMYLVHPNYMPQMLSRTGHILWTIVDVPFVGGPFLPQNTTAITMTASVVTGNGIDLTASAAFFDAGHVGAMFQLGATGYCVITSVTSSTAAVANVIVTLATAGPTAEWKEGAWSTYRGFPSVVGFYENRLFFGATTHQPNTLWGSKVGDYYTHTAGADDADPICITLNSDYVNAIKWMNGSKTLLLGTSRGQWHISPSGTDSVLTSSNIKAAQETGLTSSSIAIRSDHTVLFWQHFGRHLMEVAYDFASDNYVATPMTVLAEHIGRSPIKEMAYIQEPLSLTFSVREDGQIAVMTYERQHKVIAWSRLVTDGDFESVARIPGDDRDEIWVLVKRTVNGSTVRYVELLEDLETYENDVEDMFYLDSGLTYDGVPVTTLSGLSHLEGKSVTVLADGAVKGPLVVTSGAITLPVAASKVHVGLPFVATVQPVRQEVKIQSGTLQDRNHKVILLTMRLYRSFGCQVGSRLDRMETVPFMSMGGAMDTAPVVFTGDKRCQFPGGYGGTTPIYIQQHLPLPMNILALMPTLDVE